MSLPKLAILFILILALCNASAQDDTSLFAVKQLPIAYLQQTEKKIKTYTGRVTSKT